jgi:hypothetical protein
VENTGTNRFCCFLCDFSICEKCFDLIESVDSSSGSVMGSNLVIPSTNSKMSKIVESVGGGAVVAEKSRRITRDSGNAVAWNDAPALKTISRDIEMKQINGSSNNNNNNNNNGSINSNNNTAFKNGITKVRPTMDK